MAKHHSNIYSISLIVATGGFLMGFDASVISGVIRFIDAEFNLTDIQLGWAVSSLTLSATLSMLVSGKLSDTYGRKRILSIAAVLYALSAILSALAPTFAFLVMARMLGGLGVGASLIIAPVYIAEIAPASKRGLLVSFNQLNIVLGISVAFFSNYLILHWSQLDNALVHSLRMDLYQWRWMLLVEAVPALLYFFTLFLVPRSPRWLIMKGNTSEALRVLITMTNQEEAEGEITRIRASLDQGKESGMNSWPILFKPVMRRVLVIGLILALLQQLVGINAIFFYAPMIFELSGFSADAAFAQAILVGLTNLVFTILAMWLIDRIGRRVLLILGSLGIALSMFVISYSFSNASYDVHHLTSIGDQLLVEQLQPLYGCTFTSESEFLNEVGALIGAEALEQHKQSLIAASVSINNNLILAGLLVFVASFAFSVGPVMWVMFSEIFPNSIRALAISLVGVINSLTSFLVQLIFPWELSGLGSAATFLIYGLVAVAGLLFIVAKVPETKGKTLEELQSLLIGFKVNA